MNLTESLQALGPLFTEVLKISGAAGASLGVLHQGEVIHTAGYGFRDIANQLTPDQDTIFVVASCSKAFVAATAGILVNEGQLNWTTQVKDIITDYKRPEEDSARNATVEDFLSHRSGIAGLDGYWMLSEGREAFPPEVIPAVVNTLPTLTPIRSVWGYMNFGYELVGQVIERISGQKWGDVVKSKILEPLGMHRTFDTRMPKDTPNVAVPYASLKNRTLYPIPIPLSDMDGRFSAPGGIRTSVSDLLKFHKANMDAAQAQYEDPENGNGRLPDNPLKLLPEIWTPRVPLPFPSLREHSYGLGWARVQLPSIIGLDGPRPWKAVIGKQATPSAPLVIYHQGIVQGYMSFVALIPETTSAVVALVNSLGLNEASLVIGTAALDTLLNATIDHDLYKSLAQSGYEAASTIQDTVVAELKAGIKTSEPSRPLESYFGRYSNAIGTYFIDIAPCNDTQGLTVNFMGAEKDTFKLYPYDEDTFYWPVEHDELMKRGRVNELPGDFYLIKFKWKPGEQSPTLYWRIGPELEGDGEAFGKVA